MQSKALTSHIFYPWQRTSDSSEKKRLVYESHDLALKALEYDKNNYMIHKWIGISLSEITNFEGPTSQIEKSFIIKVIYYPLGKIGECDSVWMLFVFIPPFAEIPVAVGTFRDSLQIES